MSRKTDPRAWALKEAAVAWYGTRCVGLCGQTAVEELFVAPVEALLDAGGTMLIPGKTYRLGAQHLMGLHTWIIEHEGPASHAVFCWECFKFMGRTRRRSHGIVDWRHKRAVPGFNAVKRERLIPLVGGRNRITLKMLENEGLPGIPPLP